MYFNTITYCTKIINIFKTKRYEMVTGKTIQLKDKINTIKTEKSIERLQKKI